MSKAKFFDNVKFFPMDLLRKIDIKINIFSRKSEPIKNICIEMSSRNKNLWRSNSKLNFQPEI